MAKTRRERDPKIVRVSGAYTLQLATCYSCTQAIKGERRHEETEDDSRCNACGQEVPISLRTSRYKQTWKNVQKKLQETMRPP